MQLVARRADQHVFYIVRLHQKVRLVLTVKFVPTGLAGVAPGTLGEILILVSLDQTSDQFFLKIGPFFQTVIVKILPTASTLQKVRKTIPQCLKVRETSTQVTKR